MVGLSSLFLGGLGYLVQCPNLLSVILGIDANSRFTSSPKALTSGSIFVSWSENCSGACQVSLRYVMVLLTLFIACTKLESSWLGCKVPMARRVLRFRNSPLHNRVISTLFSPLPHPPPHLFISILPLPQFLNHSMLFLMALNRSVCTKARVSKCVRSHNTFHTFCVS